MGDEPNRIRFSLKSLLIALAALLLAACSLGQSRQTSSGSSPLGGPGTAGGPCQNVEICTLIPESQVNASLGVTADLGSVADCSTSRVDRSLRRTGETSTRDLK